MRRVGARTILTVQLILAIGMPQVLAAGPLSILVDSEYQTAPWLQQIPHHGSLATILDQVLHPAVLLGDNSGGWALVERPLYASYGDSWVWNRFSVDEVDLSDPLWSGTPALRIPNRLLNGVGLRHNEAPDNRGSAGMALHTRSLLAATELWRFGVSWTFGEVGGIFPPTYAVMDQFSGLHSMERPLVPLAARPRLIQPLQAWGSADSTSPAGRWQTTVEVNSMRRRFPTAASLSDWQQSGYPDLGALYEQVQEIDGAIRFRPRRGSWNSDIWLSHLSRDYYGMEFFRSPEETAQLQTFAVAPVLHFADGQFGLLYKHYDERHNQLEFSRDYLDPDGQELEPWYPGGTRNAFAIDAAWQRRSLYSSGRHSLLAFAPEANAWQNPLTLAGTVNGYWQFSARPGWSYYATQRVGWADNWQHKALRLDWNLFAVIDFALLSAGSNDLLLADAGVRCSARWQGPIPLHPLLVLSRSPISPDPELLQLLNPDWLRGELHQLSAGIDAPRKTIGGDFVRVDRPLAMATSYSLAVGLESPFAQRWTARIQALGKAFHNLYTLALDGTDGRYGHWQNDAFYFDAAETNYRVGNRTGAPPLYYGVHTQILGEEEGRFLFSWSFSAYNAVGHTGFGNGPLANDVGVVAWGQADPNGKINGFGAVDSDRAWNTTLIAGANLYRGLWGWLTVTHLDGSPFASLIVHEEDGLLARTYERPRGAPLVSDNPVRGFREDFRLRMDAKLSRDWAIGSMILATWMECSNLLDFGNEIVELQSAEGFQYRAALFQEVPRALTFGVELRGL